MARTVSVSISLQSQPHRHRHLHLPSAAKHYHHPFLRFPKRKHCNLSLTVSASDSSSSSSSSSLPNPLQTGRFLTNEELENLEVLGNYSYHQELESGLLWVRLMREEEMDMTVSLLSESFAESMMMATGYVKLLEFLVKNYLIERRGMMPHSATLLGIYRENGEEDFELAGTVELTFDNKGANANPPTPIPPKNSPYICNMAVRKPLRRIIDEGPFNMYTKAGYSIVKTDSILTLLTLQRRRHLMRKELPVSENASELDTANEQPT
ncbi:UNVERIFIED_CONTAM: hypothetical protein Sradi_2953000 [Sesamum radiatum]|uniref:Uncharacterized protein n=1 Tax=Sesamum radiatum TaxID=300843 RepID=A0AAW2RZM5_SESRA